MYKRIHDRFGTAGVVIGVIALVAALGGTAFAAKGALTGNQKKEVEKIAKKFAGKPGAPGAPGAPGTKGDAGGQGAQGAKGDTGSQGPPGPKGNTVLSGAAAPVVAQGAVGDFYIKTGANPEIYGPKTASSWGSPTALKGTAGAPGSPWTAGGTLPPNATETGVYATPTGVPGIGQGTMSNGESANTTVSFLIPTTAAPTFVFVPGVAGAEFGEGGFGANAGAGCPGVTAAGVPQAASGKLCVYGFAANFGFEAPSADVGSNNPSNAFGTGGATPSGTILTVDCVNPAAEPEEEICFSKGLWAVTG